MLPKSSGGRRVSPSAPHGAEMVLNVRAWATAEGALGYSLPSNARTTWATRPAAAAGASSLPPRMHKGCTRGAQGIIVPPVPGSQAFRAI